MVVLRRQAPFHTPSIHCARVRSIDTEIRPVDAGKAFYDERDPGGECQVEPNGSCRTEEVVVQIPVQLPELSTSGRLEWACRDSPSISDNAWTHTSSVGYTDEKGCHFNVKVSAPQVLRAGVKCVALVFANTEDEKAGFFYI